LPESRGLISSWLCLARSFHSLLVPVKMVSESRGKALGSSTPSPATLVGVTDDTFNVDFGQLSQAE